MSSDLDGEDFVESDEEFGLNCTVGMVKPNAEIIWIINGEDFSNCTISTPNNDGHGTYRLESDDFHGVCSGSGQCVVEYRIIDREDEYHVLGEGEVADLTVYCKQT